MLLKPNPSTFAMLPDYFNKNNHNSRGYSYPSMAARMYVDIYEGYGGKDILGIADILRKKP